MKKIYIVIIVIGVLMLGIILFTTFTTKQSNNPPSEAIPTPYVTQIPHITRIPEEKRIEPPAELLSLLPYKSDAFLIEYYAPDKTIIITLSQSPTEVSKKNALTWIQEHGAIPNEYNIVYVKSRYAE